MFELLGCKALRCTFLGERKNSYSSKFVQLLLLNRVKARWSENYAAQGFHFINSFISNFLGPNSKTCTCEVRAARSRVSRGLTVHMFNFAVHIQLQHSIYSKALRYTASSCTDLAGARFWIGSKKIWDERIYEVKTLSSTVFWSSCLHPIK